MIAMIVYALCAMTSATCAWLLLRMYRRSRSRLLVWSALSFTAWAICNVLVFADFVVVPDVDLSILRSATALIATLLLVFGLIWDPE